MQVKAAIARSGQHFSITNRLLVYCNRKMLMILLLGFSSGLPISLVLGTLQAWYKDAGVDIITIGILASLNQPYAYKFLWAPAMDKFIPPFLGRRRGWILITQLAICLILIVMSFLSPNLQPILLASLGLVLAFCSASQDIAYNAYQVEVLTPDERGLGAALGIEGYRLAMIVSGGLSLILADNIGWRLTYLMMATLMSIGIIATFLAKPSPEKNINQIKKTPLLLSIVNAFKDFFTKEKPALFLALIICYKLGDAFSHALCTPFLLDLNFSLSEVGTIVKLVGTLACVVGIFFGGLLMTRIGLFWSLLFFGILQGLTNLSYMLLAIVGKNYILASTAFFIESLCGGMGTAAFTALLMSLCSPRYTATQFALFTSLFAAGRAFVGPTSGWIVFHFNWWPFYLFTAIAATPGLILLITLKNNIFQLDQRKTLT